MSASLHIIGSVVGTDARERAIERREHGYAPNGGALFNTAGAFVGWSHTHGLGSLVAHDIKVHRTQVALAAALSNALADR